MWLNLRTEYSFGMVYGHLKEVVEKASENGCKSIGITDLNSTWAHVQFDKLCKLKGIKPVFGVQIAVVERLDIKEKRLPLDIMSFIALNNKGLQLIYRMVDLAYRQFYYIPRITYKQLNDIKESDVSIIASYSPRFDLIKRHIYLALMPSTPLTIRQLKAVDYVACCDNYFINEGDDYIYEPFADNLKLERKTTPMHILNQKEWCKCFPELSSKKKQKALKNRDKIFKKANTELTIAKMVKFKAKKTIEKICSKSAEKRKIDLTKEPYKSRYERELKLIQEKDFTDYFFIVADLVKKAKKEMLVGHARGSSAGSLVCYLMGITEVDPIKFGLVFERFIDINRKDLPDIDIDFQDNKRNLVIKYLQEKYGKENVAQLGNVSRLKPRSAIVRFSKSFKIPPWEVEEFKESLDEGFAGDSRANKAIEDSFNETLIGEEFLKNYPNMLPLKYIEGHASHTSVHAAGILVSNKPITNYCGINSRENSRIAMIDKDDAELLNLLKIDALGLRTLTILSEICDSIGKKHTWLYSLPLDDKKTYKTLNKQRLTGIFQFEGDSIRKLAKQMPIENIDDISALTSICRPGPMIAGAADNYVKRRSGKDKIKYIGNNEIIKEITSETMGVIIYQEQVMNVIRLYAGFSWEDTSTLRKLMAKSKGDEAFSEYKEKFIQGSKEKGFKEKEILKVWESIKAMGQYAFNKSHAVSYSIITYLCAYLKTHYPLEFAVATLNNSKDDRSSVKLLRELKENEKIKHIPFDVDKSLQKWTIYKGKLLGGLSSIEGVGTVSANKIIKCRKEGTKITAGIQKHLDNGKSPFNYLYPAKEIYGEYYKNPNKFGVFGDSISEISSFEDGLEYCFIGMLTRKNIRDMNEAALVKRRKTRIENENTTFLSLTFEDDTGFVYGNIGFRDFEDIGLTLAEEGKVATDGKFNGDWYLVFGIYNKEFNSVQIKNIKKITKEI